MTRAELIARLEGIENEYRNASSVHIRDIAHMQMFRLVPAIIAALRDDGWQPIASAPQDGTHILIWNKRRAEVVRSIPGEDVATHWRPLPAPPERADG